MKYLKIFFTLILFSCNEPEVFSCPGGQTEDICGACCNNSSIECSTGPNKGVMDACGTCFGEVENEAQCLVACEDDNQDQCSSVLCEDETAGNYNLPIENIECPCNYNYSLLEVECCEQNDCNYIVDWNYNGTCYIFIDNPVLEIDLQFLLEDDFCHGDSGCNNYTNRECCENITDSSCVDSHELSCEWIATFTTQRCRPIYFVNTSEQDITITTINTGIDQCIGINNCEGLNNNTCNFTTGCEWEEFENYNPIWNNFLEGDIIPAGTIFDPIAHTYYQQNVCSKINHDIDTNCSYDNKDECNANQNCNWYESYDYIIGNTTPYGAFQTASEYSFCIEGTEKCGTIIIE
ncbi:MAG: hypothetical protein CMG66_05830 [Candidatus Marinimicrobia bacterium]|nr:hypothetical protein [Candidatus Neomarinimicrobiota bacterium]|tara:strand:- start:43095 stop:44141 length:1047 start_codon:yes stop_codon:yes gene_type:complete